MPKGAVTTASIPSRSVRFGESPSVRRCPQLARLLPVMIPELPRSLNPSSRNPFKEPAERATRP